MVRQLTHDGQAHRSGLGVPLHVAGMAGVVTSLTSRHLKHILYRDPPPPSPAHRSKKDLLSAKLSSDLIQIFASPVFVIFPFPAINFY